MTQQQQQSLSLCILYSVASGFLRVVATMVLAYPDYLEKQQQKHRHQHQRQEAAADDEEQQRDDVVTKNTKPCKKQLYIIAHLLLLLGCAILSIFGTMNGPISLAVPIQTGSGLLFNVAVMGIVLRMRRFDKNQRTGTYVVFFSVLSLVDVGPRIQPGNQNAAQLLSTTPAVLVVVLVTTLMVLAAVWTRQILLLNEKKKKADNDDAAVNNNKKDSSSYYWSSFVLLLGTTMTNVGMATSSKTFASLHGMALSAAFVFYVASALLGILFSVVSSTVCDQAIFTPLSSVALIVVNMIIGLVVWQDYKAIDTWIAYICCCFLMCCGVYLLAEIDLIERFWRKSMVSTVLPVAAAAVATPSTSATEVVHYHPIIQPSEERPVSSEQESKGDQRADAWRAALQTQSFREEEEEEPSLEIPSLNESSIAQG